MSSKFAWGAYGEYFKCFMLLDDSHMFKSIANRTAFSAYPFCGRVMNSSSAKLHGKTSCEQINHLCVRNDAVVS